MTRLLCLVGIHDYHVQVNLLPSPKAWVVTAMEAVGVCRNCGKMITERHQIEEDAHDAVATSKHKAGQVD